MDYFKLYELREKVDQKLIDVAYSPTGLRWTVDRAGRAISGYYECVDYSGNRFEIRLASIKEKEKLITLSKYKEVNWIWNPAFVVGEYKYVNHVTRLPKVSNKHTLVSEEFVERCKYTDLYRVVTMRDQDREEFESWYSVSNRFNKKQKDVIVGQERIFSEKVKALVYYESYDPYFGKSIDMLDEETSESVNVFRNHKEVCKYLGIPESEFINIVMVCRGRAYSAYGYKWSWA